MFRLLILVAVCFSIIGCTAQNSEVETSIALTVAAEVSRILPTSPVIAQTKTPSPTKTVAETTTVPLTPTAASTPTIIPTATVADQDISPSLSLIPYDYSLEDVGGGWNEGQVWLAFENNHDQHVIIDEYYYLDSIILETVEGVVYQPELTVVGEQGFFGAWSGVDDRMRFSTLVIPPGYRFEIDGSDPEDTHYYLSWRSAASATPLRIIFPDYPHWNFDISQVLRSRPTYPFDQLPQELHSLSSLEGYRLLYDPEGLEISLTGRCIRGRPSGCSGCVDGYWFYFSAVNHDQFFDSTGNMHMNWLIFDSSGFAHQVELNEEYSLGPGQDDIYFMYVLPSDKGHESPIYFLSYYLNQDGLNYVLHSLDECVESSG